MFKLFCDRKEITLMLTLNILFMTCHPKLNVIIVGSIHVSLHKKIIVSKLDNQQWQVHQ